MFTQKKNEAIKEVNKEQLDKVREYIQKTLKKGFRKKQIRKALLTAGWPKKVINDEMSKSEISIDALSKPESKAEKYIANKKPITITPKQTQKIKPTKKSSRQTKISQKKAQYFLRDVATEKSFWINNGAIIKNLEELSKELKNPDDNKFNYHVNKEKNDFAKWVNEVVLDKNLAKDMSKTKTKQTVLKILDDRIKSLKEVAKW